MYRLSATADSRGWRPQLPNALGPVRAGSSVDVPVHAVREPGSAPRATITLTAASESDPSAKATSTCDVNVRDTTPAG